MLIHRICKVTQKRDESTRGSVLVEFALVALTFFLLSFALIDFAWLSFSYMNLQDAVREAGRYASTGNHQPDPKKPGAMLDRVDSINQILRKSTQGPNIESVVISSTAGGVGNAGGPGDTVKVTVHGNVPLLTTTVGQFFGSDNRFHFTVSSTFKNEPFQPSQNY
jgi:Flp pilus assembly protein TadG